MIKVGQSWRNRAGDILTVDEKRDDGRFAMIRDGATRSIYSVNEHGLGNTTSDNKRDLVERVSRVYIAGPMTGLPRKNFPAFHAAAADYRKRGCFVINPAEIWAGDEELEWSEYMRVDLAKLMTCEMLILLPGWTQSKGARLEHHNARELKFAICYPANEIQPKEI